MKTIGILGGMAWGSTLLYYKAINELTNKRLGRVHSAKIAMVSLDFEPIQHLQHEGDWKALGGILGENALNVERAGADFLLISTNTMHKVAPLIEKKISIPILHIADATAASLLADGVKKVGLLSTLFTMEQDFYKSRLVEKFGLQVEVPASEDRQLVHKVIFEELSLGVTKESSKKEFLRIIDKLAANGCQSIILGCTELPLLVQPEDTAVPLCDTALLHAEAAVKKALS